MEIVPSTFIALIALAAIMISGLLRGLLAFCLLAPLGAAAAFNLPAIGGATIGVLDLAALGLFGAVLLGRDAGAQLVGTTRFGQPGFWIVCLGAFCVLSAVLFPRVFDGQTIVFGIARGDNDSGIVQVLLRPTTGNITQLFRIFLGVITFLAIATALRRRADPEAVIKAMVAATILHVALGWIDVLTFAAGVQELMEPIRTANYAMLVNHRMVGLKRMVGGFPEASSFGYFTLALFGFWLQYWVLVGRSRLAGWMLVLVLVVLLRSTSSSAYVSAVIFLVLFASASIVTRSTSSISRRAAVIWIFAVVFVWLAVLGLVLAYQFVEPFAAYLDRAIFDKLDTDSGVERSSWNAQAFQNFLDTAGFGAGLGSVRASSWIMACLGSIGVIGTGFFLAFLVGVLRAPARTGDLHRDAAISGFKAGCVAMLISAMLTHPTPDLGIFFFAMAAMAVGLSRGGVLESRENAEYSDASIGRKAWPNDTLQP